MTRWAAKVDPRAPLPEYPRPQMVRSKWMNLNGLWQFEPGKGEDAAPTGRTLAREILVPYPVESALSGVMEHHERVWYRRTFAVPPAWRGQNLKLHFGAVDYQAEVFVNGRQVGSHQGGYEPFTMDVTPYVKASGPQELIVRVFDPTDAGGQPRGKQTLNPGGIMYTPTTGIWQTVWIEPVPKAAIRDLHMVPDVDASRVRMTVNADTFSPLARAKVTILDGQRVVATTTMKPGVETAIPVPNAKLWSPDAPFLYSVKVALVDGKSSDAVASYFGMRKISVGKVDGVPRLLLNNKFVFQIGPLDQGFWPDGLYTAPTDEALRYDLETTKRLGFNMVRKHIKVEPARWYYHADKLGLLVWQDLPSANSYTDKPAPLDKAAYEKQLRSVVTEHWNSPAIVMWVIFNEGQGRHDTRELSELAKTLDPSRLVNRDSGAGYEREEGTKGDGDVGDVDDVHSYPPPAAPLARVGPEQIQALACGEYGGIGFAIKGHLWKGDGWGYTSVATKRDLEDTYGIYTEMLRGFRDERGLSAAVYTQITDVEVEINGLMTYDRVLKADAAQIALANRFRYPVPTFVPVVPTSETAPQTWRSTFSAPAEGWTRTDFDDSAWATGPGAFGSDAENAPPPGTAWTGSDVWLRRRFVLPKMSAREVEQLILRTYHDDGFEVYVNGVLATEDRRNNSGYEYTAISDAARRALVLGGENVLAVHCQETGGAQYVDVGLFRKIPGKIPSR